MEGMEQLDKARERIIETIAQNIHLYGLTSSAGRLYGMMFFQRKPITLDEMKEELGMSKTSMSTSVRALSDLKMVERVWKKGVRKDLYQVEEDWYQGFIDLFSTKWKGSISVHKISIKKSITELKTLLEDEQTSEDVLELAREDLEKLEYIFEYFEWLERVVETFEEHQIFDFVPKKKE
ncbi:GbsR/MarR family transcriptional regulator [Bacillus sp. SD088]|uniref:GbsR/MarR family transcriptional regulator n=1 Tax=Bacillus sp. SD088 TaxID=2782012 RepID=UPI001A96DD92|nr:GbsR/MarR family transcriptional regulator [Bacillus sp. SD088]MBO0992518.1 GbsR/MarR family transcriptional regulator [Bacillus sp. SD088]